MNLLHILAEALGQHPGGGSGLTPALPRGVSIGHQPGISPAQLNQDMRTGGLTMDGLHAAPQHSRLNLGVPYGANPTGEVVGQGGRFNPGFTPLQGSIGHRAYPQSNHDWNQARSFNPQDNPNQQNWLQ